MTFLFAVFVGACTGGSSGDPADAGDAGEADAGQADARDVDAQLVECLPPIDIADESALLSFLEGAPWSWVGPYTTTRSRVTRDVTFTAEVHFDPAQVSLPEGCVGRDDCRQQVAFSLPSQSQGSTCEIADQETILDLCSTVAFESGATLRFRATVQDTHPFTWNAVPVMEILPECEADCAEGVLQCPADNTGWGGFQAYCRRCLELPNDVCPCLTEEGEAVPNGEDCFYLISGDMGCEGVCQEGTCEADC